MPVDCIFCRIVAGEIPAAIVARTDGTVAFRDVNPQAPTHVLVVPTRHFGTARDAARDDGTVTAELVRAAVDVASDLGLDPSGYRLVINTGRDGGQTVDHLHVHLLGGRAMHWPPG